MTNLKEKLSASVRQAKAGIQPAPPQETSAAQRRRVKSPATATPRSAPPLDGAPTPSRAIPSAVPGGYASPDRVWPD